jgi:hypothetical protein
MARGPMNLFCVLFGHTWTPGADNPKTAWNVDADGQLLKATPAAAVTFYEECVRCRNRRPVEPRVPVRDGAARN